VHPAKVAELKQYVEWQASGRERAPEITQAMLALDPAAWDGWFTATPAARDPLTLHHLLETAHGDLDRDPPRALALTGFVLRHMSEVSAPPFAPLADALLRGSAWMERGNALYHTDDVRGALAAYVTAAGIFSSEPPLEIDLAAARRGEALARHTLGETETALSILGEALAVFEGARDRRGALRCRFYLGVIEFDLHRYERAAAIFSSALEEAAAIGDEDSVTRLHNNLGHCAELLQDRAAAIEHLTKALKLFEERGMTAERPRAILGLAHLLADDGLLERALVEMKAVQSALLASGRKLQAAATALDILEILTLAGDEERVYATAAELVVTFARAGLAREAMRALTFVRGEAARRTLRTEQVAAAWRFMHRLETEPRTIFHA